MANGLARAGWDKDLREGEAREDALVHVFLKAKVEHKADHRAKETGNVFVEYSQPTGPSGISTTTAHWWAFEIVGLCWVLVETERLKALVKRAAQNPKMKVNGGDGNRYKGVLVPVKWLVQPFEKLP